jgi:hypothetical protein
MEPVVPRSSVCLRRRGGSMLTATDGTWSGAPITYSHQWQQYSGGVWTTSRAPPGSVSLLLLRASPQGRAELKAALTRGR